MKNRVGKAWSQSNAESYNTGMIPETDKMTFRPYLIQALAIASPALRAQFTSVLHKILACDYPDQWPEFHDLTLNLLHSNQISEVYAGLSMLLELTKIYRWKSGDGRAGLESVVTNIFPVALQIANRLLLESSSEAGTMLVLVLKAYKSAIAVLVSENTI
jgi:importin-7